MSDASTEAQAGEPCPKESKPTASKPEEAPSQETQPKLPPLSEYEFRQYNRLAVRMNQFHEHFRHEWTLLWNACVANKRPQKMSIRAFISTGLSFAEHLTMHHGIEEAHVFPALATKMPEFSRKTGPMVLQHVEIHAGLERFEEYLRKCQSGEVDFEMAVLKERMGSWGEVLWKHLDEEVKTLGAENMRKYWTKEELARLPM